MKEQRTYKIAADCLCIAGVLVLLFSCASFDIGDWPSRFVYPHNGPSVNLCGLVGAFCAYYLLYYVGPGVFIVFVAALFYFCMRIANVRLSQPVFRVVGLVLLMAAGSSSFFCIWPGGVFSFPFGSGGVIGVGAAGFLKAHFAFLGTFILLTAVWVVGLVLLADSLVARAWGWLWFAMSKFIDISVPAWSVAKERSAGLSQIWRKLSIRQKTLSDEVEEVRAAKVVYPSKSILKGKRVAAVKPKVDALGETSILPAVNDKSYVPAGYKDYILPPLDLLVDPEYSFSAVQGKVVKIKADALERLLSEFNIHASVIAAETGPVVTMFELELAAGVKVSQISSLSNDMARALSVGAIRVVAPLPGKHTIGIEVPNSEKEQVRVKNLVEMSGRKAKRMHIPLFLGKDSSAEALVSDLTEMPHLLIAGTTGSGKSVCINSIITSILLTKRPDEVKLILIDPKMVEMAIFNTVPHLMSPIVTETGRAVQVLEWATVKMDERYALLAEAKVRNIASYNSLGAAEIIERLNPSNADEESKIPKRLPYIVIIIDELADLMMTAPKEIEAYIVRLAQKSRAVGIHIVLATQRPQATVVTGLIKSNMPTRIGFRVAARMDSRIILDQNGAETLLGQGDMLFLKPGTSDLVRAQGTFIDDVELRRIVKHLKEVAEPQFHPELTQLGRMDPSQMCRDELFDDAVRAVLESGRGSVSLLQRRLSIGYARASRIIEMMAASGILGEYKGSQAREVTMKLEDYERIRRQMEADEEESGEGVESVEEEAAESVASDYVSEGQKEYLSVAGDE